MPTKLRNLKITRVAVVDEGANPDAHIRFAKNRNSQPEPEGSPGDIEKGIIRRVIDGIAKAFGIEPVEKKAYTFAQGEEKRDYDRVMSNEVYPIVWAFTDSVYSILTDTDKSDEEKAALLKQSLSEFSVTFGGNADKWAKAESAETEVNKDVDVLAKVRDTLNQLIEKAAGDGDDDDDPDDHNDDLDDDDDDDSGKVPSVKKGATNMLFDTSKMTPEEKATYEDLAKRFGTEEPPTGATPPAGAAPAVPAAQTAPAADDDVYKNLHPAVKAELEEMRKFREEAETAKYVEVAKKYSLLGKKPEELGAVLKSLAAVGGTAYADMIGVLDANLAMVEGSGVFGEIGKRGGSAATGADDAWGKIEAAANEIIKSKPDMRWADAIDQACMQNPELLDKYEKSRR